MTENTTDYRANFHNAVAAELDRQVRLGYTPEHDNEQGLDHLLEIGYGYLVDGYRVKGAAMLIAARRWIKNNSHINPMQRDIAKFMEACEQEVKMYPGLPSEEIKYLRIKLMMSELLGSTTPGQSDSHWAKFLIHDKSDELVQSILNDDLVGIADGLADVLYVVIGTAVAYGINIQEVFDEVQRSNMSKAVYNEETKTYFVIKDEHGKVLKPESYSPAELEPIVQLQIERGKLEEEAQELIEIDIPDGA